MLKCHLNRWAVICAGAIVGMALCRALASAEETNGTSFDYHPFERPYNPVLNMGFVLTFSRRYYQAVETTLQEKSYFDFRYYLASPFDSFDKRQYISENPTQAGDLAWRALHNAIRKTVDDIELVKIIRDYVNGLTSLQMVIGADGTQLQGPSLTGLGLQYPALQADPSHKMVLSSGLTFAEDFKLGLMLSMTYHGIVSKLRYYPTSRNNEVAYTAETQLTASTKIALSYNSAQSGGAVLATLSYQF